MIYKKSFHFFGRRQSLSQNPSIFKTVFGPIKFCGEKFVVGRDERDRIIKGLSRDAPKKN